MRFVKPSCLQRLPLLAFAGLFLVVLTTVFGRLCSKGGGVASTLDGGRGANAPSFPREACDAHPQWQPDDPDDSIIKCTRCPACGDALPPSDCSAGGVGSGAAAAVLAKRRAGGSVADASAAAAAAAWFSDTALCPLYRSMWVVSTLTPRHPREALIMERLHAMTSHSSWGVLLISLEDEDAPAGSPIVSTLGPNIAVMNVSLALLNGLPLSIAPLLAAQLSQRAVSEWGRRRDDSGGDGPNAALLTVQGRLHVALKALPYLLAIKCGATAIFDTVDDELALFTEPLATVNPWMVEGEFAPALRNYTVLPPYIGAPPLSKLPTWPVLVSQRADVAPVVNPYSVLGGRLIHPRGFPAELVYNASFQALHLQRQVAPVRPLIQQWVSHAYPDLSYTDMTHLRTHELPKLLKSTPTVVLERGAWAPFNARGTLFLPGAYWALFLPPAQPDVLRAYWATPLLWAIGGTVGFRTVPSPPPPITACGSDFGFHHDRLAGGCEGTFLFRDIADRWARLRLLQEELELQSVLPPLIAYLEGWQYTPTPTLQPVGSELFRRASALMCNLAETGQLASCDDAAALAGWLADLGATGYTPPIPSNAPTVPVVFHLRGPDPELLTFNATAFEHGVEGLQPRAWLAGAPYMEAHHVGVAV